jgi:hypothetical protein
MNGLLEVEHAQSMTWAISQGVEINGVGPAKLVPNTPCYQVLWRCLTVTAEKGEEHLQTSSSGDDSSYHFLLSGLHTHVTFYLDKNEWDVTCLDDIIFRDLPLQNVWCSSGHSHQPLVTGFVGHMNPFS